MSIKRRKNRAVKLSPLQHDIVESIKAVKPLMGEGGALTSLIKGALEAALEGEIESHLDS